MIIAKPIFDNKAATSTLIEMIKLFILKKTRKLFVFFQHLFF